MQFDNKADAYRTASRIEILDNQWKVDGLKDPIEVPEKSILVQRKYSGHSAAYCGSPVFLHLSNRANCLQSGRVIYLRDDWELAPQVVDRDKHGLPPFRFSEFVEFTGISREANRVDLRTGCKIQQASKSDPVNFFFGIKWGGDNGNNTVNLEFAQSNPPPSLLVTSVLGYFVQAVCLLEMVEDNSFSTDR